MTYAKSVTPTLVRPGNPVPAIEFIELRWQGDPRVNIQNAKGKAKPYQVRQVVAAVECLEVENG